jgi:hypothetical protein
LLRFPPICIYADEEGEMLSVLRVQEHWLSLLGTQLAPGDIRCTRLEPGHFVVVLASQPAAATNPAGDYRALESCLGSLEGTRAIYLDSGSGLTLGGNSSLRAWAGDCAAGVESGAKRAFAIVDMGAFRERMREELVSQGWAVAHDGDRLKVSAGMFSEQINVPREAVRMVLGRGDFAAAAHSVREEMAGRLARDAKFFAAFRTRFRTSFPATLDHFFLAYPEGSCMAAGWDYWQLAERPEQDAETVFEEGMKEIEILLQTAREEGPPGLRVVACCGHGERN